MIWRQLWQTLVGRTNAMNQDALQAIEAAAKGLEYPSESDTPFDVFRWPAKASPAAVRDAVVDHGGKGRKVDEVPVDQFFADLTGSDDAARFEKLKRLLVSALTGLKVFRVGDGEPHVDLYLIGKTPEGDWAGLHTQSVET